MNVILSWDDYLFSNCTPSLQHIHAEKPLVGVRKGLLSNVGGNWLVLKRYINKRTVLTTTHAPQQLEALKQAVVQG